jgi:hypothetical protein
MTRLAAIVTDDVHRQDRDYRPCRNPHGRSGHVLLSARVDSPMRGVSPSAQEAGDTNSPGKQPNESNESIRVGGRVPGE